MYWGYTIWYIYIYGIYMVISSNESHTQWFYIHGAVPWKHSGVWLSYIRSRLISIFILEFSNMQINSINSSCYFTLTLGVVSAVCWSMSVSVHCAALPCWHSFGVWQLWVLPAVCQAGGWGLHRPAALRHTPWAAVWLQCQLPWRTRTVCWCEQSTLKMKQISLGKSCK